MTKLYFVEDTIEYHNALKYEIDPQLRIKGINPEFIFRKDNSTLAQDLIIGVSIVLIDYDLGKMFGDEIIAEIDSSPEYKSLPIIFYSGGESLESLRNKTKQYGNVRCCTKHDLGNKIIEILIPGK